MNPPPTRYDIPNLRNACHVIKVIATSQEGLHFKFIQSNTGIPRTTLIRILKTLENQGFVRQRSNKSYLLGNEFLRIGLQFSNNLDLNQLSAPFLKRLALSTRATSHLAVPAGNQSLIIAVQESPERIQASSKPGFLADLHRSSTGKCFLAYLHEDVIQWIHENQTESQDANILADPSALARNIENIHNVGYAIDDEEFTKGVRCCAAPVFNAANQVIAAIGVTAPTTIFPPEDDQRISDIVVKEAFALSAALGYRAP